MQIACTERSMVLHRFAAFRNISNVFQSFLMTIWLHGSSALKLAKLVSSPQNQS